MAFTRGSRFRTGSGRTRRASTWNEGPLGTNDHSVGTASIVFPTAQQAVVDGLTLVRIRGELMGWLVTATTVSDGFREGAFGMCIVSENAAGIGATAIPDPRVDDTWDGWLLHRYFSLQAANTGPSVSLGPGMFRFELDGKAMRKFKSTDTLVAVSSVGVEIGAVTARITLNTRMLTKLS